MPEIRRMEIDDIECIASMDADIFPDPWTETGLFTYLIRNDTVFLVAEEGGKVAGYAGAQAAADEADIITVAVEEKMRGRGMGNLLLGELVKEVSALGSENVYLEVRASNGPARALYSKFGFTECGVRKNYYSDPKEDAVTMKYNIKTERK